MTIRYLNQPLSHFVESYTDADSEVVVGFWILRQSLVQPPNVSQPTLMNGPQQIYKLLAPLALPGDPVHPLACSQPVVFDLSSSNAQSAQQFFDYDTVPSADWIPFQLLDSLSMFPPIAEPKFVWGTIDSFSFIHCQNTAYCEVRHWVRNSFMVHRCSASRTFVSKLVRLFCSVGEGSALDPLL